MNHSCCLLKCAAKLSRINGTAKFFTQIFSFLSSWKNKRNLSLTLRLDLFSKSENSFFQVRKQFFPSQKTVFSKSENNVFQVRKECFPSQKRVFSKSENALKNHLRPLLSQSTFSVTMQLHERLLGRVRSD